MPSTAVNERRGSFRVNMNALISSTKLSAHYLEASEYFPELHSMALLNEANSIEQEMSLVSERIKDLAIKRTIELLRSKVSLLEKLMDIQTVREHKLKLQLIDISEGGCSTQLNKEFRKGERIAIALIFPPTYFSLFAFAEVIDIPNTEDSSHYHLAFTNLTEIQKQMLMKHMFQAQTLQNKP